MPNIITKYFRIVLAFLVLLLAVTANAQDSSIIDLSRASTVKLISKSGNSSGSGFFIDSQHILTCFHVIAKLSIEDKTVHWSVYSDLQAILPSGEIIDATVVSLPTQTHLAPLVMDFALVKLKAPPSQLPTTLALATDKEALKVGDDVLFSGYPLATPGMVTPRGMVSGFDSSESLIFVQASINKGNSGGALLNSKGHVVGLVSMREGGISRGLSELNSYIDKNTHHGSVQIMGVDALQATKAIIQTLDEYISTGIGYARSVKYAREYLDTHKEQLK